MCGSSSSSSCTHRSLGFPFGGTTFAKLWWAIGRGIPFLWALKGVVVFGGYPYPEREKDGYFQRVRAVDSLLGGQWRVYVDLWNLPHRTTWYDRPAPNTLVLRIAGGKKRRLVVTFLTVLCVLRCRAVWFHSVHSIQGFGCLMKLPGITSVLDVHGAVPEECLYQGDVSGEPRLSLDEKLAVSRADYIVVVSTAMGCHLQRKYTNTIGGQLITFPIFPKLVADRTAKTYRNGEPIVVYAGGLQKWQQVPKIVDAIGKTADVYVYELFCPDPTTMSNMLPKELQSSPRVMVDCKPHTELLHAYRQCHFGLLLREDTILNHVACPTKLVEYIAMGIVPILESPQIGDFESLGMRYVRLQDLVSRQLPDEETRNYIAQDNLVVFDRLTAIQAEGMERLVRALGSLQCATPSGGS